MAREKQKAEKGLPVGRPPEGTQRMGLLFGDIFGRPLLHELRGLPSEGLAWAPAIHVVEKVDKFVMKVELPGVKEEDISVSVIGDILVVQGEKQAESEFKEKGYYYSEASYGSFSRSTAIPSIVDSSRIVASYDKGVLEIDLPKAVEVEAKKISVTAKKKEGAAARIRRKRSIGKEETGEKKG